MNKTDERIKSSIVKAAWDGYRAIVVPRDAGEVQVKECRHAFYSGCMALLATIKKTSELEDDMAVAMVEMIERELFAYRDSGGRVDAYTAPAATRKEPLYEERGNYLTLDIVAWFKAHEMLLGPGRKANWYYVKCPWADEHTTTPKESGEDTCLVEDPGRWPTFTCSHAHCKGRDILEVAQLWGDIDNYCREKLQPKPT